MLNQFAVTVRLKIGLFKRSQIDKTVSKEVAVGKKANDATVRVSKILLPNSPSLEALRKLSNQIRKFHYDNTLPWEDTGYRMLPNQHYTNYDKKMKAFGREFQALKQAFVKAYQEDVQNAQQELGDMFNEDDYPNANLIDALVYMEYKYDPIANDADFRINVPNQQMQQVRNQWREREKQMLVDANKHLWERFHDIVSHANERLSKDGAKFHYTLPASLAEFRDVLKGLNITDDKLLDKLAEDAATIAEIPLDQLRNDPKAREQAAQTQAEVLEQITNKMESFVK